MLAVAHVQRFAGFWDSHSDKLPSSLYSFAWIRYAPIIFPSKRVRKRPRVTLERINSLAHLARPACLDSFAGSCIQTLHCVRRNRIAACFAVWRLLLMVNAYLSPFLCDWRRCRRAFAGVSYSNVIVSNPSNPIASNIFAKVSSVKLKAVPVRRTSIMRDPCSVPTHRRISSAFKDARPILNASPACNRPRFD